MVILSGLFIFAVWSVLTMWVWEEIFDSDSSYGFADWCRNLFLRLLIQACAVGIFVVFMLSCIQVKNAIYGDAPTEQPITQSCEPYPTEY